MENRNVVIHRNEIENFLMKVKDFFKHHRRSALAAAAGVFVLSVVVIGAALYYDHRSESDLLTYESLLASYETGDNSDASFDAMMTKLVPLVESSKWGYLNRYGEYILGGLYFAKKKYALAQPHYEKFAKCEDNDLGQLALLQAGACAEETGSVDKALDIYKSFETRFKESKSVDRAVYDLGRMYQKKGDLVKARESYSRIITQYSNSPYAVSARQRLFTLNMGK